MNSIEKYKMFKSYLLMMKYVSVFVACCCCCCNGMKFVVKLADGMVNNKLCFDVNIIMFMFMT